MFFQIQIRHIFVYGYIYDNGMFEVNMWDFEVDDYWFRDGRKKTAKAAWRMIYHVARDTDRINHIFDEDSTKELDEAIEMFFDEDLEMLNLDEDWE